MKQLICSKLLELMETQHYESVKVTDLVKYIGIGRSTFYSHFDSIYAVLQTIEDDFIAGLPLPEFDIRESLLNDRKLKTDYLNHLKKNKRAYLVLNGPNGDPSFRVRLSNHSRRILLNSAPAGLNTPHALNERRAIYEFYQGGNDRLVFWWLEHDDEISVADMVTLIEKLMTDIFHRLTEK